MSALLAPANQLPTPWHLALIGERVGVSAVGGGRAASGGCAPWGKLKISAGVKFGTELVGELAQFSLCTELGLKFIHAVSLPSRANPPLPPPFLRLTLCVPAQGWSHASGNTSSERVSLWQVPRNPGSFVPTTAGAREVVPPVPLAVAQPGESKVPREVGVTGPTRRWGPTRRGPGRRPCPTSCR
jgi:hypothetical protein